MEHRQENVPQLVQEPGPLPVGIRRGMTAPLAPVRIRFAQHRQVEVDHRQRGHEPAVIPVSRVNAAPDTSAEAPVSMTSDHHSAPHIMNAPYSCGML